MMRVILHTTEVLFITIVIPLCSDDLSNCAMCSEIWRYACQILNPLVGVEQS